MRVRRMPRRVTAVALVALFGALLAACDDPPTTKTTTVVFNCQATPGGNDPDGLQPAYAVTAPQAVKPGAEYNMTVTPEVFTLDAEGSGGTVTQLTNMVWRVQVPANATIVSHSIAGWSNVGSGTPTSSVAGNIVSVTIPGPIRAGNPATLPTISVRLQATGALGARIEPRIAGTSHNDPGLSFTARVDLGWLGIVNSALKCFPSPSPALHSTLISQDAKAPVITITAPVADQVVVRHSTVVADFSCNDGGGVGVAACVGTVSDGAPIDTSTLGTRTFTVTATDHQGLVGTKTVTYTVVSP
jgi:dehydratase